MQDYMTSLHALKEEILFGHVQLVLCASRMALLIKDRQQSDCFAIFPKVCIDTKVALELIKLGQWHHDGSCTTCYCVDRVAQLSVVYERRHVRSV
jgi:hypothetical protein